MSGLGFLSGLVYRFLHVNGLARFVDGKLGQVKLVIAQRTAALDHERIHLGVVILPGLPPGI